MREQAIHWETAGTSRIPFAVYTGEDLHKKEASTPTLAVAESQTSKSNNPRYISKEKHQVWMRDKGACTCCGGKRNLHYDHVIPVALGGLATVDNLRLLCFSCNARARINVFGEHSIDNR